MPYCVHADRLDYTGQFSLVQFIDSLMHMEAQLHIDVFLSFSTNALCLNEEMTVEWFLQVWGAQMTYDLFRIRNAQLCGNTDKIEENKVQHEVVICCPGQFFFSFFLL